MDTKELLLAERGKTHGDFSEHAAYSQSMKALMRTRQELGSALPIQVEALELIGAQDRAHPDGDPTIRITGTISLVMRSSSPKATCRASN
jgi:hypothetical protein